MISKPLSTEFAPYYEKYIALVPAGDILVVLGDQVGDLDRVLGRVGPGDELYRYGPDKWTIRSVVGHLIDVERLFGFRAFCFSRGEQAPLPSFDENAYVAAGGYDTVRLPALVQEFVAVRAVNLAFLQRLEEAQWMQQGTASGHGVSVRALTWIMAGHVLHHRAILLERYAGGFSR